MKVRIRFDIEVSGATRAEVLASAASRAVAAAENAIDRDAEGTAVGGVVTVTILANDFEKETRL